MNYLRKEDLDTLRAAPVFKGMPTVVRDDAILTTLRAVCSDKLVPTWRLLSTARELAKGTSCHAIWDWADHKATLELLYPELVEAIAKLEAAKANLKLVAASTAAELEQLEQASETL